MEEEINQTNLDQRRDSYPPEIMAEIERLSDEKARRKIDAARKRKERARAKQTAPSALAEAVEESRPRHYSGWPCKGCETHVPFGTNTCPTCGAPVDWRHTPLVASKEYVVCPNCGASWLESEYGDAQCPYCGAQAVEFA